MTRAGGANSRAIAHRLLADCLEKGQPLDRLLAGSAALSRLEPRDRAFLRHMLATTLRRLGQIDAALAGCLERPLKPKQGELRALLRLGAAQILFMAVPAHAAVGETVALASGPLKPFRGLANAVLRRLAREDRDILERQDESRLNLPDWLWESWSRAYGEEETRAIARTLLKEPPLDITVKDAPERWAAVLGASLLPGGSLRLPAGSGDIAGLAGYRQGAWWVQDAAAALPARLLGDLKGNEVFDLCAAPGGKTAQLILAGGRVTALDRDPHRLEQLRTNLERLGLEAESIAADLLEWRPETQADAILLDAPCSATGTLRRHPDIAWLRRPSDIGKLAELQGRLLARAAQFLKPGGRLVYAVCSLQPEEGPGIAEAFLRSHEDFSRLPLQALEVGGLAEAVTAKGDLLTLPSHLADRGGLDGFYACRLERRRAAS